MTLPWRGNMSVLDDSVVQVPVEALLDICHIFHLFSRKRDEKTLQDRAYRSNLPHRDLLPLHLV